MRDPFSDAYRSNPRDEANKPPGNDSNYFQVDHLMTIAKDDECPENKVDNSDIPSNLQDEDANVSQLNRTHFESVFMENKKDGEASESEFTILRREVFLEIL